MITNNKIHTNELFSSLDRTSLVQGLNWQFSELFWGEIMKQMRSYIILIPPTCMQVLMGCCDMRAKWRHLIL